MRNLSPRRMVFVIGVAFAMLAGCAGGGSGSPGGSGSLGSSGSPGTSSSPESSGSPGVSSSPESTGEEDLKRIDFAASEPVTIGDVRTTVVTGTFALDGGGEVIVTISGTSAAAIKAFAGEARFRFALGEANQRGEETPIEPSEPLSQSAVLSEPNTESLLIEFVLSPETAKEHPTGSLIVEIDPTVKQNYFNNFSPRDPSTDFASVTVAVKLGRVEMKLYRRCQLLSSVTRGTPATESSTLTGSGAGYFDLTVKGLNTNDNTYLLKGAWNYDYGILLSGTTTTSLTCG